MQVTPAPLPLARADNFFLVGKAGAQLKGNVLGNDLDPLGKPLTAVRVAAPAHGTATLNPGGAFVYTPTPGVRRSTASAIRRLRLTADARR